MRAARGLAPLALALAAACAAPPEPEPAPPEPAGDAVYRRAQEERLERLEREVERLRADLVQAEEALVAVESGLRGRHTRAEAVSAIAEARIELERAERRAPWRKEALERARAKVEEAGRQLEDGLFGTAIFFASRASRIATNALEEAGRAQGSPDAHRIDASRVNLREGPSTERRVLDVLVRSTPVFPERSEGEWLLVRTVDGRVGWVHASLVD